MTDLRAKPQPLRPILEALAEETRCQAAAELFDLVSVKQALVLAAKAGQRMHVLRPSLPLDLRGTPAADKLKAWADKEGLTVEWGTPEPIVVNGFEIARMVPVAIGWNTPRLTHA